MGTDLGDLATKMDAINCSRIGTKKGEYVHRDRKETIQMDRKEKEGGKIFD